MTVMAVLGCALLVGFVSGCGSSTERSNVPDPAHVVDRGSWYVKEAWPHDGLPFESEHFVVYSDGASVEARKRLAALAEDLYVEVVHEMGIDPVATFRFPADQDKIDLYANRYHVLEGGGARAYYAGVIIASFDHQATTEDTDIRAIRVTLKHELVHVVEALLKGRFVGDVAIDDPRRMPVWFSEGSAEAISGGASNGAPGTLDEIDRLTAKFGTVNPISWRVDIPFSDLEPGAYPNYYYPMAHLAVDYLLDPRGLGRSAKDIAAVMLDMGNDVPFDRAFENHMGISQTAYEEQFFALMDSYLPQSESPVKAIAAGLLSLLAASLVAGAIALAFRHWPIDAPTTQGSNAPEAKPKRRMGFLTEIALIGTLAVGFTALLLVQITGADLPPYVQRTPGYLTTVAYLTASTIVLVWAIRSRSRHPHVAYLIPLLVPVATSITIVAIELIF